ncbi:DUF1634 domain-containing protein [Pedobacter sp. HMF7647]|uniref:DUF1634 domain-containing protein n=1 Tax=Hufsiella arboris TaxID=2695275 RepID=A0A7K1Y5X0_9SPHI|nr:DUF1634 domain-containing protein [Hufsiella arboris]MXV49976.1 DUF1634 domain-containing protein [Hufsiella arboris]
MKQGQHVKDSDLETIMGSLLRIGVLIAATVVLIGGILYLFQHGRAEPHYHTFSGEPKDLKNIKSIFTEVFKLQSTAIIQLGVLVLIATPIARIIFSIVGFVLEKDYLYVVITFIVLGIIAFSMLSGLAG